MIKALVRTAVLIVVILVAAQFIPFVAHYEWALIALSLVLGLMSVLGRILLFILAAGAVLLFLRSFFF